MATVPVVACPELGFAVPGWRAERDPGQMCRDAWAIQAMGPDGYEAAPVPFAR